MLTKTNDNIEDRKYSLFTFKSILEKCDENYVNKVDEIQATQTFLIALSITRALREILFNERSDIKQWNYMNSLYNAWVKNKYEGDNFLIYKQKLEEEIFKTSNEIHNMLYYLRNEDSSFEDENILKRKVKIDGCIGVEI